MSADLQRDPETYAIIGAAMEVHRELGNGFLQAVHQDSPDIEFARRRIEAREADEALSKILKALRV